MFKEFMELKMKLLCLIPFILLLMGVSPNDGLRFRFRQNIRFRTVRPPTTPPSSSSSVIPQKKCQQIIDRPDKRYVSPYVQGPICVRLNESQKLDRLQYVGGYNPRYVAVNRREAQQFVSLVGDVKPLTTKHPNPSCNQSDLLSILLKPNKAAFAGDEERRSGNNLPSIAGTTTIQQCFDGGSLLEGGLFRRLCTECFAITQLPTGVFPPFINEVICGQSNFCVPGIGACQQKVLRFNFLRFTGNFERDDDLSELFGVDVFVEELETFEEDIRACCECRLFSFLG